MYSTILLMTLAAPGGAAGKLVNESRGAAAVARGVAVRAPGVRVAVGRGVGFTAFRGARPVGGRAFVNRFAFRRNFAFTPYNRFAFRAYHAAYYPTFSAYYAAPASYAASYAAPCEQQTYAAPAAAPCEQPTYTPPPCQQTYAAPVYVAPVYTGCCGGLASYAGATYASSYGYRASFPYRTFGFRRY